MALSIQQVQEIPPSTYRKGPRDSKCREVVEQARAAPTHKVAVSSPDEKELGSFYKSMVQWRIRHKDEEPVRVRKDKDTVFVWIEDPVEPGRRTRR